MPLLPVAVYGLEVPPGDILIPAVADFPATFRITMAAIDPTEEAHLEEGSAAIAHPRATLKIIRTKLEDDEDDDEDDEENEEYMRALLAESDSDEESDDEDEANGGPSDPTKSKKARKQAALQQLMDSIKADDSDSDEDMEDAADGEKKAVKKGKAPATGEEEESEEESEDDDEDIEVEEFVLCTLDPEKHFQQPLDITIAENERVFFKVTGTHTIYLTGNYVIPDDNGHNHHHEVYDSDDESDEDYDLSPDEDELEELDDEEDELDGLRITEVESEEEDVPKLVKSKDEKKGKNKRSADELEEPASLDDIISKSLKGEEEPKLSKKQLKKLKKNNGEAAATATKEEPSSSAKSEKSGKKVEFAEKLVQGPTPSGDKSKAETKDASKDASKVKLGVRTVDGVKIDDKKIGSGPAAKDGHKVGMRYIGKLTDGKVFDSNKKGKPFSFKLGKGEVIKGWDIGVAGMQVGGERRLTIPAKLAYGSKGLPGIPANSTLVFDIKLLEIK